MNGLSFLEAIQKPVTTIIGNERWKRLSSYRTAQPIEVKTDELGSVEVISSVCLPHVCNVNAMVIMDGADGSLLAVCFHDEEYSRAKNHEDGIQIVQWIGPGWSIEAKSPIGDGSKKSRGAILTECGYENWGSVIHDIDGAE